MTQVMTLVHSEGLGVCDVGQGSSVYNTGNLKKKGTDCLSEKTNVKALS
jgi:hypothetical protein